MSIRNDSKKIVEMLLKYAVEQESFSIAFEFDYSHIASTLELESVGYCKICFMYLTHSGFLVPHKESGILEIKASAIDFLEVD